MPRNLRLAIVSYVVLAAMLLSLLPAFGSGRLASAQDADATPAADAAVEAQEVEAAATSSLNKVKGNIGDWVTFSVSGFGAADTVDVYWDNDEDWQLTQITTNASGNGSGGFFVPAEALPGNHSVWFRDSLNIRVSSSSFKVIKGFGSIWLSSNSGRDGDGITWSGYGCADDDIELWWEDAEELDSDIGNDFGLANGSFQVPDVEPGEYTLELISPCAEDDNPIGSLTFLVLPDAYIVLSTNRGPSGMDLDFEIFDFDEVEAVDCGWDGFPDTETLVTNGDGYQQGSIVVPQTSGVISLICLDDDVQVAAEFTVDNAAVMLGHHQGPETAEVEVDLEGFEAYVTVELYWDDEPTGQTITVNRNGNGSGIMIIPAGAELGVHEVRWQQGGSSASTEFLVTEALATLEFPSAQPGTEVGFDVVGMLDNCETSVFWNDTLKDTISTDNDGELSGVITVPAGATAGVKTVGFECGGVRVTAQLRVIIPSAVLSRAEATAGSRIGYTIRRFPANSRINIFFDGTLIGTVSTNASGYASGTFRIPEWAGSQQDVNVQATDPSDPSYLVTFAVGRWSASSGVTVVRQYNARITLNTHDAQAGQTVSYTLRGFSPNSMVTIKIGATIVATKRVDRNGYATGTFRVPNLRVGTYTLTAWDNNYRQVSTWFDVHRASTKN